MQTKEIRFRLTYSRILKFLEGREEPLYYLSGKLGSEEDSIGLHPVYIPSFAKTLAKIALNCVEEFDELVEEQE